MVKEYYKCIHKKTISDVLVEELKSLKAMYDFTTILRILCCYCHRKEYLVSRPEIYDYAEELLTSIMDEGVSYSVKNYEHYLLLDSSLEQGGY